MKVVSVSYYEDGYRSVGLACNGCLTTHQVRWPSGCTVLHKRLECGNYAVVQVPLWARGPRRDRTRHRYDPSLPHSALTPESRDDAAIDEPVPNWTE